MRLLKQTAIKIVEKHRRGAIESATVQACIAKWRWTVTCECSSKFQRAVSDAVTCTDAQQLAQSGSNDDDNVDEWRRHIGTVDVNASTGYRRHLRGMPAGSNYAQAWRCGAPFTLRTRASVRHVQTLLTPWETAILSAVLLKPWHCAFLTSSPGDGLP